MAPRVHPCVCRFTCLTYPQMKRHRKTCLPWQTRTDPAALTLERLRRTRAFQATSERQFEPCPDCGKRPDHHISTCPRSQAEQVRKEALVRNGINPKAFALFLIVLRKRYPEAG